MFTNQELDVIIKKRLVRAIVLKAIEIEKAECRGENPPCGRSNCPQGQQFFNSQIAKLESDNYSEGTYDIQTLKQISYNSGFQVTFCQIGDNYTNKEFADLTREFLGHSSDRVVSAGKFGGTPEISFNVASREVAIELGKKYNQESVLDWAMLAEDFGKAFISTGGTGRR